MKIVNKFKVNTFNKSFKEVWKYCKDIDTALRHRKFAESNGLASSVFEFIGGKWYNV